MVASYGMGSRVVILSSVFRHSLLQELHTTHLGMNRMNPLPVAMSGGQGYIHKVCCACVVECCAANRKIIIHIPRIAYRSVLKEISRAVNIVLINTFPLCLPLY